MGRRRRVALLAACLLWLCSSSAWAIVYLPYTPPTVTAEGMGCWPRSYTAGPVYAADGAVPGAYLHAVGEDKDQRCDTGEIVTDPLTYKWNFGDGSAEEWGEYRTHEYTQIGQYTVTCTAYDTGDPKYADEGYVTDTITVYRFGVDLDLEGTDDDQEYIPGGMVRLNSDDDDDDHLVDGIDPSVTGGDDELATLTLAVQGTPPPVGGLRIDWKEDPPSKDGWGGIRVFAASDKSGEVTRQTTYAWASLPKTLYVEGAVTSHALADVWMTLNVVTEDLPCLCLDAVNITVVCCDLDVDTNRNNNLEDPNEDEWGEDDWVNERGAIFLVNCDDDNNDDKCDAIAINPYGNPVDEDLFINSETDCPDVTPLLVRPTGLVTGLEFWLRFLDPEDAKCVHVFGKVEAGQKSILGGPEESCTEVRITDYVSAAGDSTLGVEGLFYRNSFSATQFDGDIDLELQVKKAGQVLWTDQVRLKVAPWILLTNDQSTETIWAQDAGSENADFRAALNASGCLSTYGTDDRWAQDHVQIGYSKRPGAEMWVALQLPRGVQPDWPVNLFLGHDRGLYRLMHNFGVGSGDFGGNLEGTPPNDAHGIGRIVLGDSCSADLKGFLDYQEVQSPFLLNSKWLDVGHIDEYFVFDKAGRVIVADTRLARALLNPDGAKAIGSITAVAHQYIVTGTRAGGHISAIPPGDINDGETFTLGDGTGSPKTFEFEKQGGVGGGAVAVDISEAADANEVADAIAAAINDSGLLVQASVGGSLVTVRHEQETDLGNVEITETVADPDFLVDGMVGGSDGETFTLGDGAVSKTFQFLGDYGDPEGNHVGVSIEMAWTDVAVRDAIVGAINGVPDFDVTASSGSDPIAELENDNLGSDGNVPMQENVAYAGFLVDGMDGGRDPEDAPPEYAVFFATSGTVGPGTAGGGTGNRLYDGPAIGWITAIPAADINDGETFTLSDGANTETFEFEKQGGVQQGNVEVDISGATTADDVRDAIVSAINGTALQVSATAHGAATVHLWNDDRGTAGNVAMTETVSEPDFEVEGMAHGSSGRDFTAENWQYLRLYDGTGAGQTAQISARHDGWVEVGTVWNTGSDFVGESACFYAYAMWDEEASHKSEWFTSPAADSKYVVVEGTRFYVNHDTGEDTAPAIVTAKEVFENAELWTLNANAQEIIKGEKPKLQHEAGVDLVFKWVPVIYFAPGVPAQYVVAFTPGAANFKSAGDGQSFFATQYGPRNTSGIDVFQQCVTARLNSPVSTPDWEYYHRYEGEVHCGVAARRALFGFKWWERL